MKSLIFRRIIIIANIVSAIFFMLPIIEEVNNDKFLFCVSWFIFFLILVNAYIIKYGVTVTVIHKQKIEQIPSQEGRASRENKSFLSLYFKRKKLEQINRIKELEEKIK